MTSDQKKLLHALGVFIAFKVLLGVGIHYAAKTVRDADARNRTDLELIRQ